MLVRGGVADSPRVWECEGRGDLLPISGLMRRFSAATAATGAAAARPAPAAAPCPEILRNRLRQRYFHRNHVLTSRSGLLAVRVTADASVPTGPLRLGRSSTLQCFTYPA